MRRNTVTLLKYLLVAIIFLVFGPMTLKLLLGGKGSEDIDIVARPLPARGLPQAPEHMHHQRIPDNNFDRSKKIDWHDWEKIEVDKKREGPGEQGAAVILSAEEEKQKDALYKVNGFNAFVSDKISLDRNLKDIRHPDCHKKTYLARLPNVSVIVPFHNEHWTTLLRTAQSVLNRSPEHLVHEVILVDDFSNKEHCKKPLDDYLATHYNGKVKVVRASKREGLIRTRLLGAKKATGEVLIFLDSHVEANVNWLPPLLEPIAIDYKTVVCPFIDVIDYETFAYRAQDEGARGAFDWEFFYKRLPLLPEDLKHPAEPFKSPVMAGGLFAIHRDWFWDLGGYDPGLDIWGGEQYELSFKIWMCGGQMVDASCSRMGHIYRKFNPFPGGHTMGDFVGKIWMCGGQMVDAPCSRMGHIYRRFVPFPGGHNVGDYVARLWQCGGQMVDAPCSRVGHVYRKFAPFPNPGVGDFVGRNYRRVAEVWMDEYAEFLYKRRPHYRNIDPGDLTEQLAIRDRHQCKSFKWFMTEVAFDLVKVYPPIEPPDMASGELRNIASDLCVDTRFKNQNERFGLEPCIKDQRGAGGEQQISMTWHKDLRPKKRTVCFDVSQSIPKAPIILYNCHGMKGNQHWKYNLDTSQLYHPVSGQCLDCDADRKEIYMNPCNKNSVSQQWKFERMNVTLIRKEWTAPLD